METKNRDSLQNAALPKEAITDEKNEGFSGETTREAAYEEADEHLHAMAGYDDPEEKDEDDEDNEDDESEDEDHEGRDLGTCRPGGE